MKRWIDGVLRPWKSWEDLDLKVWRAKGKEPEGGDDDVDRVRDLFSQLDLQ